MFATLRRLWERPRKTWRCLCRRIRERRERCRRQSCCCNQPKRIAAGCAINFRVGENQLCRLLAQGFVVYPMADPPACFPGGKEFTIRRIVGPADDVRAFLNANCLPAVCAEVFVANVKVMEITSYYCVASGMTVAAGGMLIVENLRGYMHTEGVTAFGGSFAVG